jgi:hypothetical protein
MKPTTITLALAALILLSTLVVSIQILSTTVRPVVQQNITDCRPACLNKNSYAEGWYNSCNQSLIKYTKCQYCNPVCTHVNDLFEGWYDTCTGLPITFTDCNKTAKKVESIFMITYITKPTTTTTTTLPAGAECMLSLCNCKCYPKGTTIEETTGRLCGINCRGEYGIADCINKDGRCVEILVASAVVTSTVATTKATAITSTTTSTTTLPAECKPTCVRKNPYISGWFDSCTGKLVQEARCSNCHAVCLKNKNIPGWYDGCNSNFIMAGNC